jgi:hypothetical protein
MMDDCYNFTSVGLKICMPFWDRHFWLGYFFDPPLLGKTRKALIQEGIQFYFLICAKFDEFQTADPHLAALEGPPFHQRSRVVNSFAGDIRQVKLGLIIQCHDINRLGFKGFAGNGPILKGQAASADVFGWIESLSVLSENLNLAA